MGFSGGANSVNTMRPIPTMIKETKLSLTENLTSGTGTSYAPRVRATSTVDADGNLYELIIETGASDRWLKIVRTTPSGSRSYAIRAAGSTTTAIGVIFAVGNTIHVIFRSPGESTTQVYYFTFSGASACGNGAFTALPSYTSRNTIPSMTGNVMTNVGGLDVWVKGNNIHVAILMGDGTTNTIKYCKSSDGGASFSAWELVTNCVGGYNTGYVAILNVVESTTGKAYLSVRYYGYSTWYIYWKDTTAWASAKNYSLGYNYSSAGPQYDLMVPGINGDIMLVYFDIDANHLSVNTFSGTSAGNTITHYDFDGGVSTGMRLACIITPMQIKFVNIQDTATTEALVTMICYSLLDAKYSPILHSKITIAASTVMNFHNMLTSTSKEIIFFANRTTGTVSNSFLTLNM